MGLRGLGAAKRRKALKLEREDEGPLPWEGSDLSRADKVIEFLQYLPVTKGPLAGQKMELLPGQLRFVRSTYGDLKADGTRKRRIAVKSEPKGNGKTGLVAGLCLCHLLGPEAEPR